MNTQKSAGIHTVNYDASGLTSGIYIYAIEAKAASGKGNFITSNPIVMKITGEFEFTGGTGRFAEASGGGSDDGNLDVSTGNADFTLDGNINY